MLYVNVNVNSVCRGPKMIIIIIIMIVIIIRDICQIKDDEKPLEDVTFRS